MYPGRLDEQPIPLMVRTSCGRRPSSATAVLSAFKTPKSPQPGHQSGSALPLKSLTVSGTRGLERICVLVSVWSSPIASSSDADLVHRHVLVGAAGEDLLHAVRQVVGQERLPVVLADVRVGRDPGLRAQVAGELPAVVVLHDDQVARARQRLP